jgi:hypothetical protein
MDSLRCYETDERFKEQNMDDSRTLLLHYIIISLQLQWGNYCFSDLFQRSHMVTYQRLTTHLLTMSLTNTTTTAGD